MLRRPLTSTLTDKLFPYTTLCRSVSHTILESLHGDGRGYRESSIVPSVVSDYRGGGCTREALLLSTRSDHSLSESLHLARGNPSRSEEHTSELKSLMRISYSVFCCQKQQYINYSINTNFY